ncbi:MAG: hypothetical protein ACR2NA_05815 [Solirubrobacterales bacterium]
MADSPRRGLGAPLRNAAGRVTGPARPVTDAMLGRGVDVLADAAVRNQLAERIVDRLLEGDFVERLTQALIEADVPDRVAAELVDSEATERAISRVLESQTLERTVERVLVSREMQMVVERIANSDEVRGAIAQQSLGIAGELADEVRRASMAADDALERIVRRVLGRPRTGVPESPLAPEVRETS